MSSYKTLIVDDDPLFRRITSLFLSKDYEVRDSTSGEEALEIAAGWSPDLILLDVRMQGMDGYETCRQLRQLETAVRPWVILVAAAHEVATELEDGAGSADGFLGKPIDPARLKMHVDRFFRRRDKGQIELPQDKPHAQLALHQANAPGSEQVVPT